MHPTTFEYLKPSEIQLEQMEMLREASKVYGEAINDVLPESADKTYVMRKLRELAMWCNVAITRHPDGSPRNQGTGL